MYVSVGDVIDRPVKLTHGYNLLKASGVKYMHFKPAAGVLVTSVPGSDSRRCSAAHRLPSQKERWGGGLEARLIVTMKRTTKSTAMIINRKPKVTRQRTLPHMRCASAILVSTIWHLFVCGSVSAQAC